MASKWRVLTDPEEITRMVEARLAYYRAGRVRELTVGAWAGRWQSETAAAAGWLSVLEEDDKDDG